MLAIIRRDISKFSKYEWSPNDGQTFYPISYANIIVPPTEDSRNAMTALSSGCPVRVHAEYRKRTSDTPGTLTLKPSDVVELNA